MRRFVKRMAAAVLLSACLVSLSGCSSNQDTAETDSTISMDGTPVDDSMAQSIMLSAAQTLGVPKDQLIVQAIRLQQLFMRLSWKFARIWAN